MRGKLAFNESIRGFGLVEIVVTLGLITTLFLASMPLLTLTLQQIRRAENESRATFLAQDAIEAAKNLRDQSWEHIEALDLATTYHPEIQSEEWAFILGSDLSEEIFTRSVQFLEVLRDEEGAIVEQAGTADPNMRKVEATITWLESSGTKSTRIDTYLSDLQFANDFVYSFSQTNQSDFMKGTATSIDLARAPGDIRLDYTLLQDENFNSYPANTDPTDWIDTESGFGLGEDDDLFKTADIDSMVFGTIEDESDIHSHYTGSGSDSWTNVEVTGRFMITDDRDSFGITFLSHYPTEDKYYVLGNTGDDDSLMISARGTSITPEGVDDRDTEITPEEDTWYRFRIQAKNVSGQTLIVAKVWEDGEAEPQSWQVDCFDDNAGRSLAGTAGMWFSGSGESTIDDLEVRSLDTFTTPGVYESMMFDTEESSHFDTLTWLADTPAGTSAQVRFRTAPTVGELVLSPWYGPTGIGDAYTQNGVQEKLNPIHTGDRWMQYQVTLESTTLISTPAFEEIHITYAPQ